MKNKIDIKGKVAQGVKKAIIGKLSLYVGGPFLILLLVIFLIGATFNLIFSAMSGLFGSQQNAQHIVFTDQFPIELIKVYREAEEAFGTPWALLAGLHFVQTNFSTSKFFTFYNDDFDLPDEIWEGYKTSYKDYMTRKEYEEAEQPLPPDYEPIEPNRDSFEDIVFTVAVFLQDKSDDKLDDALTEITEKKAKTDKAKLYHWLFQSQFKSGNAFWPIPDTYGLEVVSSYFGDLDGRNKPHKGMDFAIPIGEPIYAFADGVVVFSGPANGYGNYIILEHSNFTSKDGKTETIRTGYGHQRTNLVKTGQKVLGGQKIAEVGSEGESTGPHLHFEVMIKPTIFSKWQFVDAMLYLVPPNEQDESQGRRMKK